MFAVGEYVSIRSGTSTRHLFSFDPASNSNGRDPPRFMELKDHSLFCFITIAPGRSLKVFCQISSSSASVAGRFLKGWWRAATAACLHWYEVTVLCHGSSVCQKSSKPLGVNAAWSFDRLKRWLTQNPWQLGCFVQIICNILWRLQVWWPR